MVRIVDGWDRLVSGGIGLGIGEAFLLIFLVMFALLASLVMLVGVGLRVRPKATLLGLGHAVIGVLIGGLVGSLVPVGVLAAVGFALGVFAFRDDVIVLFAGGGYVRVLRVLGVLGMLLTLVGLAIAVHVFSVVSFHPGMIIVVSILALPAGIGALTFRLR